MSAFNHMEKKRNMTIKTKRDHKKKRIGHITIGWSAFHKNRLIMKSTSSKCIKYNMYVDCITPTMVSVRYGIYVLCVIHA